MDVRLLTPGANDWSDLLQTTPHDFYHLPRYAELAAQLDGGEPCALLVRSGDNRLLLPFTRRPMGNVWDAISPYGYPGPLVSTRGGVDAAVFASDVLEKVVPRLAELGCVSMFVRLHPLLGPVPDPRGATLVQHGETVCIDLSVSEAEHWSETMSGHRYEIKRALRAGHRFFFDDEFAYVDRFVEIYHHTMTRVAAAPSYFFDRAYVMSLRRSLGTRLKLAFVEVEGILAAAGLFVETNGIVQYHLSGSDERFRKHQPTKLLLHEVRRWGRERGASWFHLGGGLHGREDSLFRFKAGFSRGRRPFHTLRLVCDEGKYQALCRERAPSADPATRDGFFPLYRMNRC